MRKGVTKKMLTLAMAAIMTTGMLAGCGSSATSNSSTDSSGNVTLKWSIWDEKTTPYWGELAKAYMDKHPNVKIVMTDLGSADYNTVLSTELSGSGSDFDVVTMKDVPGYATLISKGVIESLSDRISKDKVDLSKYNGATDQLVADDGKLYELPFRSDYWVLFYNKDVFDKAGVSYPTNDMTFDQYDALARKVTKAGFGNDQVFGAHYHTWRSAVQLFGVLDGKNSILTGNYDWTKTYYNKILSEQKDGVCRSYVDLTASKLHYSGAFSQGNTATMNQGTWFIGTLIANIKNGQYDKKLCGNWGIVKYPHPAGVQAGTTLGQVTSLAIPTSSKNKDAAWDFMKFVCGTEGAEVVAKTGNFPAIMNSDTVAQIAAIDGFPQDAASKEALQTTKVYLEAPYSKNIAQINTILDTYHKDIMNGDCTVDEGVANMNKEVKALLGK
jgi:multiple sugar transport system substrate-binding protein